MTRRSSIFGIVALTLLVAAFARSSPTATAAVPTHQTFPSAEAASLALFDAVRRDDRALLADLLDDGGSLIATGDESRDEAERVQFVEKFAQLHRLVAEEDGTTVLYIGAENWPFPAPLVHRNNEWYFDTDFAKEEVLHRRIGENEQMAQVVCLELVSAQAEYSLLAHDGAVAGRYARRFVSDSGKHDGLYWASVNGRSLIGPLLAHAATDESGSPTPFQGYFYRVLIRQGSHASGGAKNYVVNGQLTAGFAFVAYPAEYGSSGVMTFMISEDGTMYERDLGTQTAAIAAALPGYDPGSGWKRVE